MNNERPPRLDMKRRTVPTPSAPDPNRDDRATAQKEEQQLEKAASEHRRDEVARGIIAGGMWILMIVVFIVIISAVFTLGFHLLLPATCHWLQPEELQEVRNAVLSGAVVGLGTTYLRKYVEARQA